MNPCGNFALIFLVAAASTVAGTGPCDISPTGSGSGFGTNSADAFWKGVDGAEQITQIVDGQDDFIQQNPNAFIMYYTTRCPNSQNAKTGFAAAAKDLSSKVGFGAMDCDKVNCWVEGHNFNRVPQHYLYKDGEWKDQFKYNSKTKYTKAAFTDFLKTRV